MTPAWPLATMLALAACGSGASMSAAIGRGCLLTDIRDRDRIIDLLGYFPDDASPLSSAVLCDDLAKVKAALKAGADPNTREPGGETPVLIAAAIPRTDILKLLLKAGGDPNAYEIDARTLALSYAMSAGVAYDDWSAWTVLLATGADINFRPPSGSAIAESAVSLGAVAKIPDLLDRGYRNDLEGLVRDLENAHYNDRGELLRLKALEKARALIKAGAKMETADRRKV